jgi:hypothetical protein
LKVPLVAPPGTVITGGTVTTLLLLSRLTEKPEVAAGALSITVQLSVPVLVINLFAQLNPVKTGIPTPLRPIAVDAPAEELLVRVRVPSVNPATVGLYCTRNVAVWLGARVSGKVAPETEYPLPLTVAAVMVTDAAPVELNVTVCDFDELMDTSPKDKLVLLTPRVGADESTRNVNDS